MKKKTKSESFTQEIESLSKRTEDIKNQTKMPELKYMTTKIKGSVDGFKSQVQEAQ